jgi:hypothetical protein
MPEEVTNISEVKTSSDGTVKLSIETYNDLVAKANKPPTINRTTVVKTAEIAAEEFRVWGATFMGLGATLFTVGVFLYRKGCV